MNLMVFVIGIWGVVLVLTISDVGRDLVKAIDKQTFAMSQRTCR